MRASRLLLISVILLSIMLVGCKAKPGLRIPECEELARGHDRDFCYSDAAFAKADPNLCGLMERAYDRDHCYGNFAILVRDPTLCEKIENQEYKDSACYAELARGLKDPSLCEKITLERWKTICLEDSGAVG